MNKRIIKRIVTILFAAAIAIAGIYYVPSTQTEADAFEKSIASFPDSYKPALRALHKKYPKWTFVPYNTKIKFTTAVYKESINNNSLIENTFSKFLKSNGKGDYSPSSKKYIAKDGGTWVSSSINSVAYFMDPRNFLNNKSIYMFESLSYDASSQTQSGVEAVLKGTFMYKTNICYLNSKGKYIKTNTKYSAQIISAAKASKVNAYYIASKIRQEIGGRKNSKYAGMGGSGSVSGSYGSYKGIYNFYNIGAFTGANPVASGLKWAKSGKTYSRPWNTPMKSINGGAKYIGDKYINCGQNTIYYERFNVNKKSKYGLYQHQYMTNVYGAAAEANMTAQAYNSMGIAGMQKKFIIPVFSGMASRTQKLYLGSSSKKGKTSKAITMRKGPGTSYKSVVKLPKKASLVIYKGMVCNSGYSVGLLQNPYWFYVKATKGKKTYKGYVSASFTKLNVEKYVTKNKKVALPKTISGAGKVYYRTDNPAVCTVDSSGNVTGKKKKSTTIYAFSAGGPMSAIKVKVCSSGAKVSPSSTTLYTTQQKKLKVTLYPSSKKNSVKSFKTSNSAVATVSTNGTITAKKAGKATITCVPKSGFSSTCAVTVHSATPSQPTLKIASAGYDALKLSWNTQKNISAYHIHKKGTDGKFHLLKTVTGKTTSYKDTKLTTGTKYEYYVVAARKVNKVTYKSSHQKTQSGTPVPGKPVISSAKAKGTGVNLKWKAVAGATGYNIFRSNKKKSGYKKTVTIKSTSKLEYYNSKLTKNKKYYYKIIAYRTVKGKNVFGSYSKAKKFVRK